MRFRSFCHSTKKTGVFKHGRNQLFQDTVCPFIGRFPLPRHHALGSLTIVLSTRFRCVSHDEPRGSSTLPRVVGVVPVVHTNLPSEIAHNL